MAKQVTVIVTSANFTPIFLEAISVAASTHNAAKLNNTRRRWHYFRTLQSPGR
jgi:hypothetical protein